VFKDWRDALFPRRMTFSSVINWRGIIVLDVVGKLLAQDRLQVIAKGLLSDS